MWNISVTRTCVKCVKRSIILVFLESRKDYSSKMCDIILRIWKMLWRIYFRISFHQAAEWALERFSHFVSHSNYHICRVFDKIPSTSTKFWSLFSWWLETQLFVGTITNHSISKNHTWKNKKLQANLFFHALRDLFSFLNSLNSIDKVSSRSSAHFFIGKTCIKLCQSRLMIMFMFILVWAINNRQLTHTFRWSRNSCWSSRMNRSNWHTGIRAWHR